MDLPRPVNQTHLETIGNKEFLETIWKKEIRARVRAAKFRDFYFDQDPAQFAAYEWGLSQFLSSTSSEILSGTYDPTRALVIRGAKQSGLSRPVAMLSLRDSLVYRAIVTRALVDLSKHLRPWTGAFIGDRDKIDEIMALLIAAHEADPETAQDAKDVEVAELDGLGWSIELDYAPEDYWGAWLVNQRLLFHICATCEYVVQSDIANFYASLDLEVVREQLHSHTNLDVEVVRLCLRLLTHVLPHSSYANAPDMGLPQEVFNSSRTIAHSVLVDVDRSFDDKGKKGLYTRFVDDFTIGVQSEREGKKTVSRLQEALEPLGLTVNAAKTRIVRTEQLRFDLMVDENTHLDGVESSLKQTRPNGLRLLSIESDALADLVNRFEGLCELDPEKAPLYLDRVLRRYLGIFRDVGHRLPDRFIFDYLISNPKSAHQTLEYVRGFQLTPEVRDFLVRRANEDMEIYGDVPLLCLETLATSPNALDIDFEKQTAEQALTLLRSLTNSSHPKGHKELADRATALSLIVVAKFGNESTLREALEVSSDHAPGSQTFLQSLAIKHSLGDPVDLGRHVLAGMPWTNAMTISFLGAVADKDTKAIGSLSGLLEAQVVLRPNRFLIHSRPLLLLGLLARSDAKKAKRVASKGLSKLRKNPRRLRDERSEALLDRFT